MGSNRTRYKLEHVVLPHAFYHGTGDSRLLFSSTEDFLHSVVSVRTKAGLDDPYGKEVKAQGIKIPDGITAVAVTLPEPEEETQCAYIFLLQDASGKAGYYTVEGGNDGNMPFLCSWSPNGVHANYGRCTRDMEESLKTCVQIFRGKNDGPVMWAKVRQA